MNSEQYRRRRAALAIVLQRAQSTGELPVDLPEVRQAFADRSDLLRALQHQWSQLLWTQIELLGSSSGSLRDPAAVEQLARTAYATYAAAHPVLRRLLDEHAETGGGSRRTATAVRRGRHVA